MKLRYSLVLMAALVLSIGTAQIPDYSVSDDWTATDLNGIDHNLYSYLDSGYAVFIDLSAAWCSPCWTFHEQGVLQDLHDRYGPDGSATNEMRVFYIESESTNTTDQLHGIGTSGHGANRATDTEGDWVAGHTFPFIDDASIALKYGLTAYPTAMFIGADRLTRAFVGAPGPTSDQIYELAQQDGGPVTDSVDVQLLQYSGETLSECGIFTPGILVQNHGFDDLEAMSFVVMADDSIILDSFSWDGTLSSYETADVTMNEIDGTGYDKISIIMTEPVIDSMPLTHEIEDLAVIGFNQTGGVWDLENTDSASIDLPDGFYQDPASDFSAYSVNGEVFGTTEVLGGFGESDRSLLFEFFNAQSGLSTVYLDKVDLSGMDNPVLYFNHAYRSYAGENDQLLIEISDDCGGTWSPVFNRQGDDLSTQPPSEDYFRPGDEDWVRNSVSLAGGAGSEELLIRLVGITAWGNNLFIDDLELLDFCASLGVNETDGVWDMESATPGSPSLPDGLLQDPISSFPTRAVSAETFGTSHDLGGFGESEFSVYFDFYNTNSGNSGIILDKVDLSEMENPMLSFSHAYAPYFSRSDRMTIEASLDCGSTWISVYDVEDDSLATAEPSFNAYVPEVDDWVRTDIMLEGDIAEAEEVAFRFTGHSGHGNNLFLDDIELSEYSSTRQEITSLTDAVLFPNPVEDGRTMLQVQMDEAEDVQIFMVDGLGRTVQHVYHGVLSSGTSNFALTTRELSAGLYQVVVRRINDNAVHTLKLHVIE